MVILGKKFGIFTKQSKGVIFDSIEVTHAEDINNQNHPDNEDSPNAPRAEFRFSGYANPVLGDEGNGQIKRWSHVNLDFLDNLIEQMIEHYLKDKDFYSRTMCREALWNMYRRLVWWVRNQTDPMKIEYNNTLSMIKDCIYKILDDSKIVGGEHMGIELPHCPTPYVKSFSHEYFNDFNLLTHTVEFLNTSTEPMWTNFPGLFRFMSSSEDIEWELASPYDNPFNENIIVFDVNKLQESQSTKLGFSWRFKNKGYIKFSYRVTSNKGNGLSFFINGKHVGGEWHDEGWETVSYNIKRGQTYKFEWLVRNQSGRLGHDAKIFIKDISCIEVLEQLERVEDGENPWELQESIGLVSSFISGDSPSALSRFSLPIVLDNDGVLTFELDVSVANPPTAPVLSTIIDPLDAKVFSEAYATGLVVTVDHGNWVVDGLKATTKNQERITATIEKGEDDFVQAVIVGSLAYNYGTGAKLNVILYNGTDEVTDVVEFALNNRQNTFVINIPPTSDYTNSRLEIVAITNSLVDSTQTFEVSTIKFNCYKKPTVNQNSSRLRLLVDGVLTDTIQLSGTYRYPLTKGSHFIEWQFQKGNIVLSDFVKMDWVKVSNWASDNYLVVPYCSSGAGDKCVEALIRCLLDIWKNKPKVIVVGAKIWLFT